ncbi:hypothetical protein GINT2_001718 [Glugoides intestinalis]
MLIQRLSLNSKISYSTTTTLENLIENLQLSFKHILIISPYCSKSDSLLTLYNNLKEEKSISTLSLDNYLLNRESFTCSHVILLDYYLFEKFGLQISLIDKPIIVLDQKSDLPRLPLSKFWIRNTNEDAFVALFILSKLFNGIVVTKSIEKVKIFLKVFEIEWGIVSPGDLTDELAREHECVVFFNCVGDALSERVFCIGNIKNGFEPLKLDLSLAGKFKYRVTDVCRGISPAVIKGTRSFDYEKFKNIAK